MRKILVLPVLAILFLVVGALAFHATAVAAAVVGSAPTDSSSWPDLLTPLYQAFLGGHYAYGAALLVIAIVALAKRYAPVGSPLAGFVHSDLGGTLSALVVADATAMSVALAVPSATLTWGLMESSLLVGVGAAGGYAVVKNVIIEPLIVPLEARSPAWLKSVLACVLWIFQHAPAGTTAVGAVPPGAPGTPSTNPASGAPATTGTETK